MGNETPRIIERLKKENRRYRATIKRLETALAECQDNESGVPEYVPGLAPVQRQILDHIAQSQIPPTIRELQRITGLSSTSVVDRHLSKLEQLGLITRSFGKARTIQLVKKDKPHDGIPNDDS